MTAAFLFPGQGSQFVGMGCELAADEPAARAVFDEVDEALGEKLSDILFEGPDETLRLTRNAQPGLMAMSMALVRVMQARGCDLASNIAFVAGHSLGEYSALTAAGALSLSDAARLLRLRGDVMQRAVPVGEGAMAAIIGLELDAVVEIADEAAGDEVCDAANDNAPGQIVVSGDAAAVARAMELAKDRGARMCKLLPVSAPFHSSLMAPAAEQMRAALDEIEVKAPVVPVVANVSACGEDEPARIRQLLVSQVTGRVRWRECVEWLAGSGVTQLVEVGAGRVLTGLSRRINRELDASAIQDVAGLEAYLGLSSKK